MKDPIKSLTENARQQAANTAWLRAQLVTLQNLFEQDTRQLQAKQLLDCCDGNHRTAIDVLAAIKRDVCDGIKRIQDQLLIDRMEQRLLELTKPEKNNG